MKVFRSAIAVWSVLFFLSCHGKHTLFEQIDPSRSGITFNNRITENDSVNPMDVVNIYNGGGIGIGDFNNDGLPDIYFGGNMVSGRLYLNKGNFHFEDITDAAGVAGMGRWERGISVIDINNDGLMDIYICNTIARDSMKRRNILYINQGIGKDGIPHFKDMAAEYGLDIHVQSTMASFFDYDNDGDLDMYLTVNEASNGDNTSTFFHRQARGSAPSLGRLYRNDWDSTLGHAVFHDVSEQAGIKYEGFGHAATICDINNDGWKDIYVSNDFLSSNLLYINNHDGTFTNRVKDYFKHTSFNSMGQDIVDMNNDGLPDVVELDMAPQDNYRKKTMASSDNYFTYQNFDALGFEYQYVRNTFQLNQGPRVGPNDSVGIPAFSEIGYQSGIAETDWSWSPLITDFDNDGYRDMVITNGFPKDVSDKDFTAYQNKNRGLDKATLLSLIPEVKLHNYAYRNTGDLRFADMTAEWGLEQPTFSSGAAFADFDNDGAMDMVISNINDQALIYRNTSRDKDTTNTHFLRVRYKGDKRNINGLGATAAIYYDHGKQQVYENNPYRGYISSMEGVTHFGLGTISTVDSLVIRWPNRMQETIKDVKADQTITVDIAGARVPFTYDRPRTTGNTALFAEVSAAKGAFYHDIDPDFIDFNIQPLLPHKLSGYSPALAAGDIDGNGFDDLIIGGNGNTPAHIFLQQPDGNFRQQSLLSGSPEGNRFAKDEGLLIFDANGDGKPDLYIAGGGYAPAPGDIAYQDRLYINDGKGNFRLDSAALPANTTSKFCVRAMDYNHDGKLDLFVSGRVDPWNYPRPVSSFIYRNDSQNGLVKFTDVTAEVAPELQHIGMICDALFTDFDGDGQIDLVVVGEWMPVTFFKNDHGRFKNVTATTGLAGLPGWWNAIAAGDFRHTGRTDYIVGNTGLNTLYQPTDQEPVYITAKDFNGNGKYIAIPSLFLPDRKGVRSEYPEPNRDAVAKVMPSIKKKFATYKPYAEATMDEMLTPEQREGATRLRATTFQSCYLRNDGHGKFTAIPLPAQAQVSALNGMVVDDFDGDGNLDVLINGNDFGTEIGIGRYDALNGLLLKGDGTGGFTPLSILQSGIYIPGDGKALVKLRGPSGSYLVAASQNKGDLKLYELNKKTGAIPIATEDVSALIRFKNGKTQKEEFYYGTSFLSQSARFVTLSPDMISIRITDSKGATREITVSPH